MYFLKTKSSLIRIAAAALVALGVQLFAPFLVLPAGATSGVMTYTLVRTDLMTTSTATTGTVCAKPTTAGTVAGVAITFPTGYTVGTLTNWTVSTSTTTSWPKDPVNGTTSATAWPGIANSGGISGVSGQTVTLVSTTLTTGTWYCFNWTNTAALTTKSSATASNTGTVVTETSGSVAIDTGNFALATVSNDQIAVTATVTPSFNFSLSSGSAALGTLSIANPTASSTINAQVDTNAKSGWVVWADDPAGTPGLTSASAGHTIAYSPTVGSASAALSNGVEGYNLGVGTTSQTGGSGSITVATNFASGGTSYKGGGLDNTPRILATSTGTAQAALIPLTVNASISVLTPAGTDYTGTVNVIAAGQF